MQIKFQKAGLLSTIQDLGRWRYLSKGIPVSGAMDTLSSRIANIALGNAVSDAVIEFTYGTVSFEAETDLLIAYSGFGAELFAGEHFLPPDCPLFITAGTRLELRDDLGGCRTYLAIAGGWDVPTVMGSKSTYTPAKFGGKDGRALQSGDRLRGNGTLSELTKNFLRKLEGKRINYPKWRIARRLFTSSDTRTIHVVRGPEADWFKKDAQDTFFSNSYMMGAKSNRMGFHLDGPTLDREETRELLSTAVAPGTIQATNDGRLILLMADCQTTGGYPRLAQVAAVDLALCAQLRPGDHIRFLEISYKEAEKMYLYRENELRKVDTLLKSNLLNLF